MPIDGDSRSRVGRIDRSASGRGRSSGRVSGDGEENFDTTVEAARNGRAGGTGNEYIFEYDIKVRYVSTIPEKMVGTADK